MPVANTSVGNETGATVYTLTDGQALMVTQNGYVYQGANGYAVEVTGNNAIITNNGFIVAPAVTIIVTGTGSQVHNYGVVEGQIQFSDTGLATVINYGTINPHSGGYALSGTSSYFERLDNYGTIGSSGGSVSVFDRINNHGFIAGDIISSGMGNGTFLTLTNSGGTFGGNIEGTQRNDLINLVDGKVVGTVDTAAGDDIIVLDTTNATGLERIKGGSGNDTVDFSQGVSGVWVSLQYFGVQAWTSGVGVANGSNASFALASLGGIENLVGTAGTDAFYGNAAANTFVWNGNASAPDIFWGLGGSDTIDVSAAPSIWVNLNATTPDVWTSGTNISTGATALTALADTNTVENVIGTPGSDQVFGDASNNLFASRGIAFDTGVLDRFNGGDGSDTIDFSGPNEVAVWVDLAYGNHQAWTNRGTIATETNVTTPYADLVSVENVIGSSFTDRVYGTGGSNTFGFTGAIFGSPDFFDGRGGNDTFDATGSNYSIWASLSASGTKVWTSYTDTSTTANASNKLADLVSVENLIGSRFNDALYGDSGNNRIVGGLGNDDLRGEGGADTFVFAKPFGNDTIRDFGAADVIELSGFPDFSTFAQIYAAAFQSGLDTVITLSYDSDTSTPSSITLSNFTKTNLQVDDFIFV